MPGRIELGPLVLLASGPFLLPFHWEPIPTFWNEWWALVIGLAAMAVGLGGSTIRWRLPFVWSVPLVGLLTMVVQTAIGRLPIIEFGLLYAGYLLWVMGLMLLGQHLAGSLGLPVLARWAAIGLLFGATINALAAIGQWLGFGGRVFWIAANPGGIYGNLAQANHFAHYVWLGLVSALYLRQTTRVPRSAFWAVAFLLILGGALSGSRSTFLYAGLIVSLSAGAVVRKYSAGKALLRDAFLLLALLLAVSTVLHVMPPVSFPLASDAMTGSGGSRGVVIERLGMTIDGGDSPRLAIARTAWEAFLEAPWLGHGVGGYAWASFNAAATGESGPYQVALHAHNLVLHLFVEVGGVVTLTMVALLVIWGIQLLRRKTDMQLFWCMSVLGIGFIHALLEYPYWYAHFLGISALLLGATDQGSRFVFEGRRYQVYLLVIVCGALGLLWVLRKDYQLLERALNQPVAAGSPARLHAAETLVRLSESSVLAPWALIGVNAASSPDRRFGREFAILCERGIRHMPSSALISRCVTHLALAGRGQDARHLAEMAWHAYPTSRTEFLAEWHSQAWIYPEMEFSTGLRN